MNVVTASQMRQIDKDTIEGIGIPGIVLMETAGREIVRAIEQHYPTAHRIGVFVGKGNNGGDGLVIARQLARTGREVKVFLVSPSDSFLCEAETNLEIANKLGMQIEEILTQTDLIDALGYDPSIKSVLNVHNGYAQSGCEKDCATKEAHSPIACCDLLVDAIFGIGLRGNVEGSIANVIDAINDLPVPILAVDLPSGLDADTGNPLGTCIQADRTVTIGLPKRGLLVHPGAELAGKLEIVDIGFPQQVIDAQNIKTYWTTGKDVAGWVPSRPPASYKGSYGRVLVVAGSTGMTGAAALTSKAALRVGTGLVTLGIPKSLNAILEVQLSEVMTLPLPETETGSLAESAVSDVLEYAEKTRSVLAIGPGLSQHPQTIALVHRLVKVHSEQGIGLPMVVDADGLNALAQAPELIPLIGADAVLTPHPGEMARLTNIPIQTLEADRIGAAEAFVNQYRVILVLKGAPTLTASGNENVHNLTDCGTNVHNLTDCGTNVHNLTDCGTNVWINSTGNPGMATAGMGDVLTGIIAGLIAQNAPSETAAVLGVYLHGLAGDIAAKKFGMHGLIASDVLRAVPEAILTLHNLEDYATGEYH